MKFVYWAVATFGAVAFSGCDVRDFKEQRETSQLLTEVIEPMGPPNPQPLEAQSPLEVAEQIDPELAELAREKIAEDMADLDLRSPEVVFVTENEFDMAVDGISRDIQQVERKIMEQHALIEAYAEQQIERKGGENLHGYTQKDSEDCRGRGPG